MPDEWKVFLESSFNYTGIYVQTDAQVDGKFDLIYDVDPQNIIKGKNIP